MEPIQMEAKMEEGTDMSLHYSMVASPSSSSGVVQQQQQTPIRRNDIPESSGSMSVHGAGMDSGGQFKVDTKRNLLCAMSGVPERFPAVPVNPAEWITGLHEVLRKLVTSQEDLATTPKYSHIDIDSCLSGLRAPTVREEIDMHIQDEMQDYEGKLSPETRERMEAMKRNKRSNHKISRFPCRIEWVDQDPKLNEWSERNIIKTRREQTKLKTYELAHDFNDSRFKKQFVSHNYAVDAHGVLRRQLEREANKTGKELSQIADGQVVITVSFYQPVRGLKMAEFDMLGCQTLAELRDAFFCDEDVNFGGGQKYKGACFFIDGVFYTDTRDPDAPDYARWVGDYLAKKTPEKIKQREGRTMHETEVGSLALVLNQRCAYLHQGDCEHRVTFTSIRRFDKSRDCPFVEGYPVRTYEPTTKTTMCQVCTVAVAERLIFNAALLPHNPMYLCRVCCDALLYDDQGNRVEQDDFIQFDYQDVV
eukprot:GHVU01125984.1.p1 GENE.GHVU01125984.1~~GHVU01125984.1.p1  ORF type:complete len:477 (+),score=110.95 GHVU01125984.1:161-1591(+)